MSREFECPATFECRRICDALSSQGFKTGQHNSGDCKVPALFHENEDGSIGVDVPAKVKNPVLTASLLEALHPLVVERLETSDTIASIQSGYAQVLDARVSLWNAMGEAMRGNREFTNVELGFYQDAISEARNELMLAGTAASSEEVLQGQAAFDYATMQEHGIVFDDQALGILDRLAVNAMDGKSTLIVGDKGISKTQLARFMAQHVSNGRQPVFLSGHGDQTADEFIGRDYQDPETGMFVFKHGKLVDAMKQGLPVVIDEVNLADQAITMRLQDILLRKPGDKIVLHENGNEEIEIAPGFVVFATANEASERYRHRVVLDPAFRDRFDVINVYYPDRDTTKPLLDTPATTLRLAFAAAALPDGSMSPHISPDALIKVARISHLTQRLYSKPLEDAGNLDGLDLGTSTTDYLSADKPVMTDCITPRSMMTLLRRCAAGNKIGVEVEAELRRAIEALDQGGSHTNSQYALKALEFFENGPED